jgi:diguanylate cyclase (GGDEF)-like protein
MERSRRSGVPLALLFADLDHFKAINDEFGHEIGDMVLRSVASLLVAQLRRIDYVFRYGGEEFTILLPGTDLDEAARTAKRLCHAVQANELGLEDGVRLRVSLSIGVALFPEHAEDERVLLRRADLAMYQAKQEGRNRVCTWGSNRP